MVRTIVNYNAYLGYNSFIINDIIENNAYLATLIHNLYTTYPHCQLISQQVLRRL